MCDESTWIETNMAEVKICKAAEGGMERKLQPRVQNTALETCDR